MTANASAAAARPGSATTGDVVWVAGFFGLLAASGEVVSYAVRRFGLHQLTFQSPDIVWMAPVAYLVFYLPVVAVLLLLGVVRRHRVELSVAVGVFLFLTLFAMLLPHPGVAPWASGLLAAGVATRIGATARTHLAASRQVARRGTLLLGMTTLLMTSVVVAIRSVAERRAAGRLRAFAVGMPNVLVIVLDTVRRANLSVYGYDRPTSPRLSELAAEGALFGSVLSPSPWTLPSHASMFTGLEAHAPGTGGWLVPAAPSRALAEVLGDRGYATGGFTANQTYTSHETGLARGFVHYEDYPVTLRHVLLHGAYARTALVRRLAASRSASDVWRAVRRFDLSPSMTPSAALKPAPLITDGFLRWQRSVGGRPFFAFLNYFEAHAPYRPPAGFSRTYAEDPSRVDRYDAAITFLDAEVGRLVDSLRQREVLDNTILVVVADHGEQFGEHGLRGHANSLYHAALDVPLILRFPRAVPPGTRVERVVSLRNLAATITDLVGPGLEPSLPGRSLARYWRERGPWPPEPVAVGLAQGRNVDPAFPNAHGPMVAPYRDGLKYIRDGDGDEELYAIRSDSGEETNLAEAPEALPDLLRMRRVLDSVMDESRRTAAEASRRD